MPRDIPKTQTYVVAGMEASRYHACLASTPSFATSEREPEQYYGAETVSLSCTTLGRTVSTYFRYDLSPTSSRGSRASVSNHSTTSGLLTSVLSSATDSFCMDNGKSGQRGRVIDTNRCHSQLPAASSSCSSFGH